MCDVQFLYATSHNMRELVRQKPRALTIHKILPNIRTLMNGVLGCFPPVTKIKNLKSAQKLKLFNRLKN